MAPIKRAADGETSVAKKAKHTSDNHASKRHRKEELTQRADKTAEKPTAKAQKAPQASVLKDEERSFPRGGASVLTPLEHKQIQIKATQDVLFEQAGTKKTAAEGETDEEDGVEVDEAPRKGKSKRSKKTKKSGPVEELEPQVRVEGLSYKRLVQGSLVLGQIADITSRDIVLSLPNNINGYIPLTSISDKLTARIEKLLQEDGDQMDVDGQEDEDIDLHDMFSVGQYLRAMVTATSEDVTVNGMTKSRKRIELSINPQDVNRGLTKSNIVANTVIQASVASNEDHGLVMDMGLEDIDMKAFLSSNELPPGVKHPDVQEGTVFMCLVTGLNSNGRIIKLSADHQKAGNVKKSNYLTEAPNVDAFLPGTAVDMLVTEHSATSLTGKIMGLLDATADLFHSGAAESDNEIEETYKIGSKVKVRIICTFPTAELRKVGVSLLDHVVSLSPRTVTQRKTKKNPVDVLPISSIIDEATVVKVEPSNGLFLDLGVKNTIGYAHISRISDDKIEKLSETTGQFKVGSKHKARIVGYNLMDGLFMVSLEQKVLEQPFLRIEDITVGQIVKGKVEKLMVDKTGTTGMLVNLAEGITGLVPEMHFADVHLQHPERKFREGSSVTARVLSTDLEKRQIRLTLKKSLVNSDAQPWTDYSKISVGAKAPGTLINIKRSGAVVQFYGDIRGWLPVPEMSEAYIEDPIQHFHKGQVVNVRVLSVEPEEGKMLVSCKDPAALDLDQQNAFKALSVGDIVRGNVIEKTDDTVTVDLGSGIKGLLRIGQLTDGSEKKDESTMKRIRVGGPLEDVVILEKYNNKLIVVLTNKPSLRKDAQAKKLITRFEDVQAGQTVHGFVRGIANERIFVEFGGGIVGLLFKSQLTEDMARLTDFGLRKDQSLTLRVTHVDHSQQRFWLSMKPESSDDSSKLKAPVAATGELAVNPVDGSLKTTLDLAFGTKVDARIRSVRNTQVNVALADNIQGRIDVSEMFDDWEEIKDKKHPLKEFKANEIMSVRVLGMHDARHHRFLPITHRQGRIPTYELTAREKPKLNSESELLTLEKVTLGSSWVAYVNNVEDRCVWVNITPNVRGRIELMDLSDDISLLFDVAEHFPIGSALKVRVKNVDVSTGRLDLTAKSATTSQTVTWEALKEGVVLPARITKVTDSSVVVQLSDSLAGSVPLTELADDFDKATPSTHKKGEVVRVCVTEIDTSNKKFGLSMRPSKVLSSSLPVRNPRIVDKSQLKVNQVVRGFVKNVADVGVFISLSPRVTAYVRVADLSDSYIKDWKAAFQVDQLVTGKIIAVDSNSANVQMSLKASVVENDYVAPIAFKDMQVGQIITGKIRKVEDFGVFIVVDNSSNVSGLCHRKEMADTPVEDVKALYKEGDAVKAKVIDVDTDKRRISFGLKYSYIKDSADVSDEESDAEAGIEIEDAASDAESEEVDEDEDMREVQDFDSDDDEDDADAMDIGQPTKTKAVSGLSTSGFDWTGRGFSKGQEAAGSESEDEGAAKKKKRHKRPEIKEDRTGDLDKNGPQSVADFERLLLGQPNSAELWVRYMVFQRELNEIEKARQIARRALNTINQREEREQLDVWTALLHLENDYSNDDAVEEVFKEACQYNDAREIHDRMIKIYISSGKLDKADSLYQSMTKNKTFTADENFWLSFATFLMSTLSPPAPTRARALLQRATQSVHESQHRHLTSKFGALEFKSPNGDPERGRTIFEGLVSAWPKKGDLWDVYVDLEKSHGEKENVRALFERMAKIKMKKRRAQVVFKRWLEFEEEEGNKKGIERVKALQEEWEEKRAEAEAEGAGDE